MQKNSNIPTSFNVVINDLVIFADGKYKKENYNEKKSLHTFTCIIEVPLKGAKDMLIKSLQNSSSAKVKFAAKIREKYPTDAEIEKLASRKFTYKFDELYPKKSDSKPSKAIVAFMAMDVDSLIKLEDICPEGSIKTIIQEVILKKQSTQSDEQSIDQSADKSADNQSN